MDYSKIHHVAFANELSTQLTAYELTKTEESGNNILYELYVEIPQNKPIFDSGGNRTCYQKHTFAYIRNIERANIFKDLYNSMVYPTELRCHVDEEKYGVSECRTRRISELSVSGNYGVMCVFNQTLDKLNRLDMRIKCG